MSVVTTSTARPQHYISIIQVIRLARKRHRARRSYSVVLLKLDLFFYIFSFFIFNSFFPFSNTHHTRTHFMLKIRSVGENLIHPTVLSLFLSSLSISIYLIVLYVQQVHLYSHIRPGYLIDGLCFLNASKIELQHRTNIADRVRDNNNYPVYSYIFLRVNYYLQRMPPCYHVNCLFLFFFFCYQVLGNYEITFLVGLYLKIIIIMLIASLTIMCDKTANPYSKPTLLQVNIEDN